MSRTRRTTRERRERDEPAVDARTAAALYAAANVLGGLLTMYAPAVEPTGDGGDQRGPVNVGTGKFLGIVAVNARHSLFHVAFGALGLATSRDDTAARGYLGLGGAVFAAMATMGWRAAGFERGVHVVMGFAIDVWGNLAHTGLSAVGALAALRLRSS